MFPISDYRPHLWPSLLLFKKTAEQFLSIIRRYKSQFGQDKWVIQDVHAYKKNGYFVEAGASDGKHFSNTIVLEKKYGWTGICIEPNEVFFTKLQKNRACLCLQECLSADRSTIAFTEGAAEYGGMVHTYSPSHIQKLGRYIPMKRFMNKDGTFNTVPKKTIPLENILIAHNAPAVIDYLSLDTEGSEYEILKNFPFDRFCFLAITVEHNFDNDQRRKIFNLLSTHGYRRVKTLGVDDCYIHSA